MIPNRRSSQKEQREVANSIQDKLNTALKSIKEAKSIQIDTRYDQKHLPVSTEIYQFIITLKNIENATRNLLEIEHRIFEMAPEFEQSRAAQKQPTLQQPTQTPKPAQQPPRTSPGILIQVNDATRQTTTAANGHSTTTTQTQTAAASSPQIPINRLSQVENDVKSLSGDMKMIKKLLKKIKTSKPPIDPRSFLITPCIDFK